MQARVTKYTRQTTYAKKNTHTHRNTSIYTQDTYKMPGGGAPRRGSKALGPTLGPLGRAGPCAEGPAAVCSSVYILHIHVFQQFVSIACLLFVHLPDIIYCLAFFCESKTMGPSTVKCPYQPRSVRVPSAYQTRPKAWPKGQGGDDGPGGPRKAEIEKY